MLKSLKDLGILADLVIQNILHTINPFFIILRIYDKQKKTFQSPINRISFFRRRIRIIEGLKISLKSPNKKLLGDRLLNVSQVQRDQNKINITILNF